MSRKKGDFYVCSKGIEVAFVIYTVVCIQILMGKKTYGGFISE